MKSIVFTLALFAVAYAATEEYQMSIREAGGYENESQDNGDARKGFNLGFDLDTSNRHVEIGGIKFNGQGRVNHGSGSNVGFRFGDDKEFAGNFGLKSSASGSADGSGEAGGHVRSSTSGGASESSGLDSKFSAESSASGSAGKSASTAGSRRFGFRLGDSADSGKTINFGFKTEREPKIIVS